MVVGLVRAVASARSCGLAAVLRSEAAAAEAGGGGAAAAKATLGSEALAAVPSPLSCRNRPYSTEAAWIWREIARPAW